MEKPARLRHLADQRLDHSGEQATHHSAQTGPSAAEFESPEELLRHDAGQTPAPPAIAERLRDSLRDDPAPPAAPWWRRIFGGGRP